jgi:hypothetical protein
MTRQEANDIIKNVWTQHLQRKDSIPEDLADGYSIWLRGKIQQAAGQLTVGQPAEVTEEASGEQQEAS